MQDKLKPWFFTFWVENFRLSFLIVFLIIFAGLFSVYSIPKESTPEIEFGIISIVTVYDGVNPLDMDGLITEKIEKEIQDIDGIDKMTSSSSVWISSVVVQLKTDANTRNVLTDIKDRVDKVSLPSDVDDPMVQEISFESELMYEVNLYAKSDIYTQYDLMQFARKMISEIEGKWWIESIDIGAMGVDAFAGASDGLGEYEIRVELDKNKMEALWISLPALATILQDNNKNTPLGSHAIGDLNYDFRFDGELTDMEQLKNIIIRGNGGSLLRLWEIATIEKVYDDSVYQRLGSYENKDNAYVTMRINKRTGANIFSTSKSSKQVIENFIETTPGYEKLWIVYSQDLGESIIEDYKNLWSTAIQTIVLVFITILIFVGLWESIITSILLPLAFLIAFIYLDFSGMTMNFLTNFSLVLTLGIAIDTIIVIIEWAAERQKIWYHRHNAAILAVQDLKAPLIAWTATTLVAFLPLIFLPGIYGKFLSNIPVTVFATLIGWLVLSLTISTALFARLVPRKKYYQSDEVWEEALSEEEMKFLEHEREGKVHKKEVHGYREKIMEWMLDKYHTLLSIFISSRKNRILAFILPLILLVLSFIFLSPRIGFNLFPPTDEGIMTMSIEGKSGLQKEVLIGYLPEIEEVLSSYPEMKVYTLSVSSNSIEAYIELTNDLIRKDLWQRSIFVIQDEIFERLSYLEWEGLNVVLAVQEGGAPTWSAVGIKLIAKDAQDVNILKDVAQDFEEYLKSLEGSKSVESSAGEGPGQFVFTFDRAKLALTGVTPSEIVNQVRISLAWMGAGSIASRYEDNDIRLEISEYEDGVTPEDIENMQITTSVWILRVWDYASYSLEPSLSAITREDTQVMISVGSEVETWYLPTDLQPKLLEFAEKYNFPEGISYSAWGENEENSELIISVVRSFFIAIFLIFMILVLQFNSFSQPAIILYTVVLGLLWVNIGLFITGNPYSITFGIWFIALTWVVVNDSIILIDRINRNIERLKRNASDKEKLTKSDYERALTAAGRSRLQPILVTTLTTLFWVLPLAMQDAFWAWLGYTLIFGLLAGSTMTLFVTPALYYMIYLDKKIRQ